MNDLFTSTTVLLTEEFIKSCSRETLQSKLTKLRLVTGIQFCKANKSYAVTGDWERVDAAFEILTHWQEIQDHEPDFENVLDGRISKLCDCKTINDLFQKYKLRHDQSESESRVDDFYAVSNEAENKLIEKTVETLEKEYLHLRDKLKFKRKDQKRTLPNKENSSPDHKTLKRKILIQHKKEEEQNNILNRDSKDESNLLFEECSNGDKTCRKSAASNVQNTNDDENGEHVDLCDHSSPCNSGDQTSSKSTMKRKKRTKIIKPVVKIEKIDTNIKTEKPATKKQKKPGDKGYWSRAKRNDADQSHHCQECNVTLKSRKRYLEHMRRIHIREYQCKVCEKRFGYPTDLNRHKCPGTVVKEKNNEPGSRNKAKQKSKSDQEPFHCLECNYVTPVKVRLTSHIQRTHRKEFACDKCEKKFGYAKDLQKHQENIHSGSYFFCDQCSKVYKNKQIFDSHLKTHESGYIKPIYNCELCFKSLTTKYSLAVHMKTVHLGQKKVYLCQICGKKFSQRSSYKQHCNAHNGIKPYKCDICDKAFVYHKSLKEHKFMHDSIRRFTCVFCDKAFRQRTTLHIHLKTHKTVKDHICPVCGRGFAQKQAMERHERIHSGLRPYTCQICNKSFGDTSTIRRHMISLHQKNETNWREDIQSSVKKKNDYYVFGGTGQNRVYKSNPSKKPSPSKKISPPVSQTKLAQAQTPALQAPAEICQQEPGLIVINPVQNNTVQDSNYINVFNGIQGPSVNGSTSSGATQNYQTFQTLQPGTLYAIATSQTQEQTQNGAVASPAPISNGFNQVIDFSTMTFVATKFPNQSTDKHENGEQAVQPPLQVNHGHNTNMIQNATIVPLTPVTEGLTVGQPAPAASASSDSSLNQAIASIWGFVGYPSYQNQGSIGQFQPSQNQ